MDIIVSTGLDDKMLDQLHKDMDIKTIYGKIKDNENKLIFTVCGKRCYNTTLSMKKKNLRRHTVNMLQSSHGIMTVMKVGVLSLLLKF